MQVTDDILDSIVTQTNLYASQYIASHNLPPWSRVHNWSLKPFTREELQKLIALVIIMGLVNLPTLEDHWMTTWPYSSQTCSKICRKFYAHSSQWSVGIAQPLQEYYSYIIHIHLYHYTVDYFRKTYTHRSSVEIGSLSS